MPDLVRLMLLTAGLAALLFVATWTARLVLDLLHQRRQHRARRQLGLDDNHAPHSDLANQSWAFTQTRPRGPEDAA